MEENVKMDYNEEFNGLNQGGEFWKPELGVHKVTIVSEPTKTEYVASDGTKTPQIQMDIKVGEGEKKEEHKWTVTVGKTSQSLYGQLMALGKYVGQLNGQEITLVVNEVKANDGKMRKNYSVPEAITALKQLESQKPTEEKVE